MAGNVLILLAYAACSYALRHAVLSAGSPGGRGRRYLGFAVLDAIALVAVVRLAWGRVPLWVAALAAAALAANVLTARFCARCGRKPDARRSRGATRCGECGGPLVAAWA